MSHTHPGAAARDGRPPGRARSRGRSQGRLPLPAQALGPTADLQRVAPDAKRPRGRARARARQRARRLRPHAVSATMRADRATAQPRRAAPAAPSAPATAPMSAARRRRSAALVINTTTARCRRRYGRGAGQGARRRRPAIDSRLPARRRSRSRTTCPTDAHGSGASRETSPARHVPARVAPLRALRYCPGRRPIAATPLPCRARAAARRPRDVLHRSQRQTAAGAAAAR
jgi:hypothetical protein